MASPPLLSPSRTAGPDIDADATAGADADSTLTQRNATMRYKTMVLELLQEQYPTLQRRLQRERMMLKAVETYASVLKTSHEAWTDRLAGEAAEDPTQIASEALELALAELQGRFTLRVTADRRGGRGDFPRRSDGLYPDVIRRPRNRRPAGSRSPSVRFRVAAGIRRALPRPRRSRRPGAFLPPMLQTRASRRHRTRLSPTAGCISRRAGQVSRYRGPGPITGLTVAAWREAGPGLPLIPPSPSGPGWRGRQPTEKETPMEGSTTAPLPTSCGRRKGQGPRHSRCD